MQCKHSARRVSHQCAHAAQASCHGKVCTTAPRRSWQQQLHACLQRLNDAALHLWPKDSQLRTGGQALSPGWEVQAAGNSCWEVSREL